MTSTTTTRPVSLHRAGTGTAAPSLTVIPSLTPDLSPDLSPDLQPLGLVAALEAGTWAARSRAAEHLSDSRAVASRAAYAAWLRRLGTAWAAVRLPVPAPASWPVTSAGPEFLDVLGPLRADLRDVTLAAGGTSAGMPWAGRPPTPAGPSGAPDGPGHVVGALYAAVVLASDAAVLLPAALALAMDRRAPVGLRFLRRCATAAAVRTPLRKELATGFAADDGTAAQALVAAADVMSAFADALAPRSRGW